jgi:hypothetical protein
MLRKPTYFCLYLIKSTFVRFRRSTCQHKAYHDTIQAWIQSPIYSAVKTLMYLQKCMQLKNMCSDITTRMLWLPCNSSQYLSDTAVQPLLVHCVLMHLPFKKLPLPKNAYALELVPKPLANAISTIHCH